ncbi:hypothetical protein LTR56_016854 [Elasticomyces elasticus]|nr:hypothetical protein LTR56_016854 [Elasticomyces elasticus]KAK3666660.1 hypothetical protein LTR22_002609 [Elasticomyces elasticus]KAK4921647.1 hypothetical protein LTR49_010933 [Elasticomyces elasticus]KAK5758591.1 hypothetical protein LTS12_011290 [Elasticomyces elasticus]
MPPPPDDAADVQPPPNDETEQTTPEMPYRKYMTEMCMHTSVHRPFRATEMPTSVQIRIHILPLGKIIGLMPRLTDDLFLVTPATTYIEIKDTVEARVERLLKPGSTTERWSKSRLVWPKDKGQNQGTWNTAKEEILAGQGTDLYIGTRLTGPYARDHSRTLHVVDGMLAMPSGCDDRTARARWAGCEGNREWHAERLRVQWLNEATALAEAGDLAGSRMRLDWVKEEAGLTRGEKRVLACCSSLSTKDKT